MKLEIAVVTHNTDAYVHNLLVSIRSRLRPETIRRVYVWDNASSDATLPALERISAVLPQLAVHASPTNVHHGPALDTLLRDACESEWVLILDSDTEVLADFVPHVARRVTAAPAFVGQINPSATGFYAYLSHVLLHRPTYLALPPFRRDGAPGTDFFLEVQRRGLPWARFRWTDYVEHFGQGTLREIYRRGDKGNELFRFASRQVRARPPSHERLEREERMRQALRGFLSTPVRRTIPRGSRPSLAMRAPLERPIQPRPAATLRVAFSRRDSFLRKAARIGLPDAEGIRRLADRVARLGPRRVLEIGTAYGGSLYLWTRLSKRTATLVSVDLPPWEMDDPWENTKVGQLRGLARGTQRLHLVRKDPRLRETVEEVRSLLNGHLVDFFYWTGGDSREGADAARLYGDLVRPGGLTAIHVTRSESARPGGDAFRIRSGAAELGT